MARDIEISNQLKQLFSKSGPDGGIDQIDAVCVVAQSSLVRLTPTQQYIFNCILAMFGQDIAENIFLLCPFSDDKVPPVLDAVRKDKFPFVNYFQFKISALYADNEKGASMFGSLYYAMATLSMTNFYKGLYKVTPKSLLLSREVLKEREKIETAVVGLQKEINQRLQQVEAIRKLQQAVKQHEKKIDANVNFTVQVSVPFTNEIKLNPGEYVTNCILCNYTCHFPCGIPNNADKSGCAAITNQQCVICPKKCHWSKHVNVPVRYEQGSRMEHKTLNELKEASELSTKEKVTTEQMLLRMNEVLNDVTGKVAERLFAMTQSLARLDEIALRVHVMTTTEYIHVLIANEERVKRPGYQDRIEGLKDARTKALIIDAAINNDVALKGPGGKRQPIKDAAAYLETLGKKLGWK